MKKKKICIVLGTRPEAIKLAPLVIAARDAGDFDVMVCNAGQHREMTAQVLSLFGIVPDVDLDIMRQQQTLGDVTTAVLSLLQPHLEAQRPNWMIVQGDTTTTFAAALAAFYQRIPVAHIEAGLRTGNIFAPWPEEMNRRLVSELATLHFPPTATAADNLRREGIPEEAIAVTGNTGIDALKLLVERLQDNPELRKRAWRMLAEAGVPDRGRPLILITGHRRESFGDGFESICRAIGNLAARHVGCDFVYPVHPNPRVRETVFERLGKVNLDNVFLVPPLDYLPFITLMRSAALILTDSGGIQEEAPSLGKRVIVLRDVTERPEGLATGLTRLAGTDAEKIERFVTEALSEAWPTPAGGQDVYGDGRSSQRILERLVRAG